LNNAQRKIMQQVKKIRDEGNQLQGISIMENPYKLKAASMERLVSAGLNPENHEIINNDKLKFIVESYQENPEPIVIFSHYKAPLFALEEMLKKAGISYGLIHGRSGTPSEKQSVVDRFGAGEFDIFLGQTRSCKMSYDLSISSLTYYLNNSYSRDDRSQSSRRTTNLKKNTPVGMIDLCFYESMDEALVKRLRSKADVSYSFIDLNFEAECFKKRG